MNSFITVCYKINTDFTNFDDFYGQTLCHRYIIILINKYFIFYPMYTFVLLCTLINKDAYRHCLLA